PVQRREIHTKTSPVDLAVYPKTGNPSGGTWRQPSGPEAHPEVLSSPDFDPTTKVVYRSPKGATVLVEERDEGEAVRILDRTGQELSFLSPVTEADNEGSVIQIGATPTEWSGTTGLRRDQKAVSDGDEIPVDNTVGKTTRVRLLGTGGQGIEILATPRGNRFDVISQDSETQDEARIRLGSGQGIIEILGSAEGEETFRLLVNTRTGDVRLVAGAALRLIVPTLSIEAERIAIDGETRLNGSLTISDDLLVGGKVVGGG
ncbi:MAG: hypothetical protein ACYS0F_20130, partial [Planctomycetota bacterium]